MTEFEFRCWKAVGQKWDWTVRERGAMSPRAAGTAHSKKQARVDAEAAVASLRRRDKARWETL